MPQRIDWGKKREQDALRTLGRVYTEARERLLDQIINSKDMDAKRYADSILRALTAEMERLEQLSAEYVDARVPEAYKEGLEAVQQYFADQGKPLRPPGAFAVLHNEAIYTLAAELQYQLSGGIAQAGRRARRYVDAARDEALRRAGLESAAVKMASGGTITDMQRIMIKRLQTEGFLTVQYGDGPAARQVPLDVYAMTCARSTTREAGNIARENQMEANGFDLMEMTRHYPTCEICAPLQGRVYSISGKDKRFPPLSRAFPVGYHNVHPNCRHVLVPWIEELKSPAEVAAAEQQGRAPFNDPRSEQETALYNQQQAEGRQLRADLNQYDRMRAVLGDDAPKTFKAFRTLKATGGELWELTHLDYVRRNRLLQHPELALPGAERAVAPTNKFVKFLFNPDHPIGWPKGVAITHRLGYNIDNWTELKDEILRRAPMYPVRAKGEDQYGKRYEQLIIAYGKHGNPANMIVAWNVTADGANMSTAYIKEVERSGKGKGQ